MIFRLTAPHAHHVEFVSDAFGWDFPRPMHREGDSWIFEMDIPGEGRIEYQFVVDGHWISDPQNKLKAESGFGSYNSVYVGPDYKFTAQHQRTVIPLRRITATLAGPIPKRQISMVRPVGRHKDLPIVLFADGSEYEKKVKPHLIIQNLAEKGMCSSAICVYVPPGDRMKEYLHETGPYENAIVNTVLPMVRQLTPASHSPEKVFLVGASLGGLISLKIAENFPDHVRGGVHSQSGAFWASPGSLSRSALNRLHPNLKLFLDWGTYEGVLTESNQRLIETLDRLGKGYSCVTTPEGHNWTAWLRRYSSGALELLRPFANSQRPA